MALEADAGICGVKSADGLDNLGYDRAYCTA
jgi:hypothetical protein